MNIKNFEIVRLRNDEHYQFFIEYGRPLTPEIAIKLKIKPLYDNFFMQFEREDEALKKITKSAYTEKIAEAARACDRNFRAIADNNRSMMSYFDKNVVDAAAQLQIIFDSYGNIPGKGMAEKSGAYANLISDLTSERNADALTMVNLREWVGVLEENNAEVLRLVGLRNEETAGKSDVVMTEARAAVDEAYRAINRRIAALLEVEGEEESAENYRLYIRRLNVIIDRYSNIIANRRGRGGNNIDGEKE